MALAEISAIIATTLLLWDGDTFDANGLWRPTIVEAEGEYKVYYAGVAFGNTLDLGLATSPDGVNYTRYSNSQLIAPADEPSWASFRWYPKTVLYEDGLYKMWFWGNDANLFSDSNNTSGFGYATSTNGIDWNINPNAIRIEDGAWQGARLMELVKHEGQYIAYYLDMNPTDDILMRAVSSDGYNFTGDTPIAFGADYSLQAATVANGIIVGVWLKDGQYYLANSTDGLDFELTHTVSLPNAFGVYDVVIKDGTISFYATKSYGPVDWSYGNWGIQVATGEYPLELIADAGVDQTIDEGAVVALDGTGSPLPNGGALTYSWTQLAGPPVALNLTDPARPTFAAPAVSGAVTLTFQLIVDDGASFSEPDTVDITIADVNSPPVADAGDDRTIKEGAVGLLDGSNSYDPESDPINHLWSQVAGTVVTLQPDVTTAQPSFTAPLGIGQQLVFKLVVDDGFEASAPSPGADSAEVDTVAVAIVANSTPVADAGPDQTRDEGSTVMLNGTGSSDSDIGDSLTYLWSQVSGTPVTLNDPASATPSFEAPTVAPGGEELIFALVVDDDDPVNPKSSAPDEVSVHLLNINDPPRCDLAVASIASLWPPTHKMIDIGIDGVSDDDSVFGSVSLYIDGVTQDEPINGLGDGDSEPDAVIQEGDPADRVLLRAERSGVGDGRVYQMAFTATDGFESCQGSATVTVPHSRKSGSVDSGQAFNSTGSN